jgi:predicted phosphodiesterase
MTAASTPELTTVGPDLAVVHEGSAVHRFDGLAPDTDHELGGFRFRTLPAPGELLTRFATVNDVHFGETECGVVGGLDIGPIFRSEPGTEPYPELMNRGAVDEMLAIDPAVVVVKGDLTSGGEAAEYQAFLDCYEPAFGTRLLHVRGNHDAYHGATFAAFPTQEVVLPGVRLAVLDTSHEGLASGILRAEQLDWLDTLAAESDRPVLVFGHHHPWNPTSGTRPSGYFGIDPTDSEALVDLVARRPSILGYFAGHTHRNRVRTFAATGPLPWVEVASVKDFPGAWAEYRVHEGGIVQVFHRISTPEALAWTDLTRQMFNGAYGGYAFGELADRCFALSPRGASR